MNIYDASEISFKNGYKKGVKDTLNKMKVLLKENLIKPEFPWDEFFVTEGFIDNLFEKLEQDDSDTDTNQEVSK